jgi:hypothetical protein
VSRPNLPQADTGERFRNAIADAIAKCLARGEDIEFVDGRAIFTSADGTRYYITVTDDGIVTTTNIETGVASDLPGGGDLGPIEARLDALEEPPVVVRARRITSTQALAASATTDLIFNQEDEDSHTAYDPTTGEFTVPADGKYIVSVSAGVAYASGGVNGYMVILVNGAIRAIDVFAAHSATAAYGAYAALLDLDTNDVVKVAIALPSGPVTPVLVAQAYCNIAISSFSGTGTLSPGGAIDGTGAAGQLAKWSDTDSLVGVTDGTGFLYSDGAGALSFQALKAAASQPLLDRAMILWYRSSTTAMAELGGPLVQTPASATTPTKTTTSVLTRQHRLLYTGTTGSGQVIGCRTNEAMFWASAGFTLRMIFGQESNINGGRAFFGITTSTTPINSDPSDLTNIIGIGYDEGDADSGNWYLFHSNAAGPATKTDTGLARSSTGLIKLEISTEDGVTYEVRVADLETGDYIYIDTAITSNVPDDETSLRINAQIRNEVAGGGTAPLLSILYMCCEHGTHFP